MKRLHRRIFRLNDRIERIDDERKLVMAELEYHRSLDEDAQRDAAVGNYIDREEADLTAGDVRRFEKTLAGLDAKRDRLVRERDLLLARLPD